MNQSRQNIPNLKHYVMLSHGFTIFSQGVSLFLVKEGKEYKDADIHFCSFSPATVTL